eukprot:CAMPEP_0115369718 /NCGR_PEP_ID=MMETSP0270-20121206/106468_1 /TAXON_ID=71861 /ORGANISM="Scrippsiella trochoidea, Strain CCMP3099" /LENGTH=44 /DNA_ID= /DNA_START= /DNA_END= /DNA_ORIENTATION=
MNGIVNHLLSANHFKKMWNKLMKVPEPQSAIDWRSPCLPNEHER